MYDPVCMYMINAELALLFNETCKNYILHEQKVQPSHYFAYLHNLSVDKFGDKVVITLMFND